LIWVLITKASISESVYVEPNYLELKEFDSLIDAVNWGLKQYSRIILTDMKQDKHYLSIYKDSIIERGLTYHDYDYHITIYDGYVE
jgi:hypothetical protein